MATLKSVRLSQREVYSRTFAHRCNLGQGTSPVLIRGLIKNSCVSFLALKRHEYYILRGSRIFGVL